MPFVAVPGVVMVECRAIRHSQRVENRFHVKPTGGVDASIVLEAATVVGTWVQEQYANALPGDVVFTEAVATSLAVENGTQASYDLTGTNGFVGGYSLPNNVTLSMSLRSAQVGRSARGRFFWLGMTDTMVASNQITAAFQTSMRNIATQLITRCNTANMPLVIVSYRTNNAPRVGGPITFNVTAARMADVTVDSMRRRLPGRGA